MIKRNIFLLKGLRIWGIFFIIIGIFGGTSSLLSQELFGSLRGRLVDKFSQSDLIGASVTVTAKSGSTYSSQTTTGGYFIVNNIPVGRVDIWISYVGYDSLFIPNIDISSAKQTELNLQMEERVGTLEEVVVTASKRRALRSEFSSVSAASIDMKTANQFAGSLFDVARMATNLAGVSQSNDGRNDIIIRGNSPSGLIWRVNDLNVPNPNHFAGIGVTGGAVPLLNNMQIEDMAFYSSAFPAVFGNGVSGVFDIQMKKGNTEKREHYIQVGYSGGELASQGYFRKGSRSSYIASARVSIFQLRKYLGLTDQKEFIPEYMDISMKMDFPIREKHNLSVFLIAGANRLEFKGSLYDEGSQLSSTATNTRMDLLNEGSVYIAGMSYQHQLSKNDFIKTIVGWTGQSFNSNLTSVWRDVEGTVTYLKDSIKQQLDRNNIQTHIYYNIKLSPLSSLRVGGIVNTFLTHFDTRIYYRPDIAREVRAGPNYTGQASVLLQWYATWHQSFLKKRLNLNVGLYGMYFDVSNSISYLEPRVGLGYAITPNHEISIGYGLHSQLQPITAYFFQDTLSGRPVISKHDFTYSNQVVVSYKWNFLESNSLIFEAYYHYLFNVPVSKLSTFSMLNAGADFTIPVDYTMINRGTGTNKGIELTWKSNNFKGWGWFHLFTLSLFKSEYTTIDDKTFPTVFDNGYVTNFLIGKEWSLFKNKFIMGGSTRLVFSGGLRYTDLLKEASLQESKAVYDEENTNAKQLPDYNRWDIRFNARHNINKRLSQEIILEFTNVLNRRNAWATSYNSRTNTLNILSQSGFFWVIFYRFYF